jgi:Kef-type K+ transport system membrane component KefB/nucleotide-binding universal stress UspA family protein
VSFQEQNLLFISFYYLRDLKKLLYYRMEELVDFTLPFNDPIIVFAIVLSIILFAPLLFNKIKIPSIVGLILSGMLVGPNGFNFITRESILLFGTVGLLYILFLAALEIDMHDFKKNRKKSLVFGFLTFIIPITLGTLAGYYILGFNIISSLLLASMFASHTMLSYPIASRLGITKNQAVNVSVGGTIITNTASLLVLAIIASSAKGDLNQEFWIRTAISLPIFVGIVLYGFPHVGRWFFKNFEDSVSQYIFVLGMVFIAGFLSKLAGVEPIIGSFLAGLALNRLIPHTSPLMNRIEFVGHAFFIPFFLIGVGMLVDLSAVFKGRDALMVAGTMIAIALGAKYLAAFLTQKIFRYSKTERHIIFGLSSDQAAATLAAILVGYNLGLLNEDVLNGTILMILVTCMVSSFVTEKAGRKQAIVESEKMPDIGETREKILVPISNPENIETLIGLAVIIKNPKSDEPIYPLAVINDDDDAKEKIISSNKMLEKAIKVASATDNPVRVMTRIDLNIPNGILRAIKELLITDVIIGWNGKLSALNRIFGSVLDTLLKNSEQMVFVSKINQPLNTFKRIIVAVPPNAEYELGFTRWISTIKILSKQLGVNVIFYGKENSLPKIEGQVKVIKPSIEASYNVFDDWEDFLILSREVKKDDLLLIVSARKGTVSYNRHLDNVPKQLSKYFQNTSFLFIYPEQNITNSFDRAVPYDENAASLPEKQQTDSPWSKLKKVFVKTNLFY